MKRALLALCAVLAVASVTACGDDDAESAPAATVATVSTTNTTLSVEQEVEAAYLRSWDVYAHAMRTFDTSKLADVYVGDALELRLDEVKDMASANTPGRMDVEHDYEISVAPDGQTAVVLDDYLNHSVSLDASGKPTEEDPNEIVKREYRMRLVEGTWKVADVLSR